MLPIDPHVALPGARSTMALRWSAVPVLSVTVVGLTPDPPGAFVAAALVLGLYVTHCLVRTHLARRRTDRRVVTRIDLSGPVATPDHDADSPDHERQDAMVGLVIVTAYAATCLLFARLAPSGAIRDGLSGASPLVGAYAIFQAMPGLPLEGGRLFRSFAWSVTGSRTGSARAADRYAGWIATGMIVAGIWCLPLDAPRPFIGLALAATGWHLAVTSAGLRRHIDWHHRSRSIPLSRYVPGLVLPPEASLAHAARLVLEFRVPVLVLSANGSGPGVITRETLSDHPRAAWPTIPLGRAMVPIASLPALQADEMVTAAARLLRDSGQSILVIYSGDHPRAAVTLTQLVDSLPL